MNISPLLARTVVVAQIEGLGGQFAGLAAQAVAALLGIAVAWGTAILVWKLLAAMASNPSAQKLLSIVGVLLLAVALVGATPDLMNAAYDYGKTFLDGTE